MHVRYIRFEDIDRQLYNSCIHYALNGRAWAYKWYLDATARRFDVFVEGEYESVMPLVWSKNWLGRKRISMPVLTPSLGVFSVHVLSPKRLDYFVREVSARFDKVDLNFAGQTVKSEETDWTWSSHSNLVLPLEGLSYEEAAGAYDSHLLRRLAIANTAGLLVHANLKPERLAAFVAEHTPDGQRLQHPMLRVLYNAMHRGWGWSSAVSDVEGKLLAVAAFVFTHGRIAPILVSESAAGARVHALDLLFDYAIRQSAGRPVLLDFASSNDSKYAGFGAKPEQVWQANQQTKVLGVLPI